jgi:hypothetical protein
VIQPALPLHECANPTAVESTLEPLQSVVDSAIAGAALTETS